MEKLGLENPQFLIAVSSDFSLRNHAPLWLIWPLLALSLSLISLSVIKKPDFGAPLFISCVPVFLGGWRTVSVLPSDADVMVSLLLLVSALVKERAFVSLSCETSLWSLLASTCLCRYLSSLFVLLHYSYNIIKGRYTKFLSVVIFINFLLHMFIYKLIDYHLRTNKSLFHCTILSHLPESSVVLSLAGSLVSAMAPVVSPGKKKGKEKVPCGMISSPEGCSSNNTNITNSINLPTLKLPLGGSTSKPKAKTGMGAKNKPDLIAMFRKLATTRENGQKKKEFTLLGFLVGEPKEFARLFAKLRMEWKPLQGSMTLTVLKLGWFEINFSNDVDYKLIWENRPYHVFSQLLLLKKWHSGFDPTSESISQLDLWVRLHYLPEEFANAVALETIIEGNWVGSFLRMDPSHNSEKWNMFTRFCINTDIEKTFGKGVIVPDEHFNQVKFSLWFDDFSPGCGACGKSAHTFRECPNKNAQIPTLRLTIRKPSSKKQTPKEALPQSANSDGWKVVGKKNKMAKNSNFAIPRGSIYLSERSGINVTYESEESEDGFQNMMENEADLHDQPALVSVAADLHPYNIFSGENNNSTLNVDKEGHSKLATGSGPNCEIGDGKTNATTYSANIAKQMNISEETTPKQGIAVDGENIGKEGSQGTTGTGGLPGGFEKTELQEEDLDHHQTCGNFIKTIHTPQLMDEALSDYGEEQFDYEYDDLLVDDLPEITHPNLITRNSVGTKNPILISEDPPFTEKDLEEFINNEETIMTDGQEDSEGTFHSMMNSIHASSSFANNMEKLLVFKPEKSTTNSSKRKVTENVDDTATSEKRAGKKIKF